MTMGARWQLQEAKNRFSEVVERAIKDGPQTVTKHGKDAVVIVSAEQFQRRTEMGKEQAQSLAEFLLQSPLRGARLGIRRSRETGRLVKFGQ
jgi:prevent-host-death family protein